MSDYPMRLASARQVVSDQRIQFIRRADPERAFDVLAAAID
jgi:hypothetical protein